MNGKIERENIYQLGECLFYLKSHSWCVITLAVCVGVGEPVDFVYLRGK